MALADWDDVPRFVIHLGDCLVGFVNIDGEPICAAVARLDVTLSAAQIALARQFVNTAAWAGATTSEDHQAGIRPQNLINRPLETC